MPYKNKGATKEAMKRYRERQREGITEGITKAGITGKTEGGITGLPPAWQSVVTYLKRSPDNLGKLQAVAGSLGKLSDQVWFGALNMQEVGEVVGAGVPVLRQGLTSVERDHCGRLRGPMDILDVTPLCGRTDDHVHSRAG